MQRHTSKPGRNLKKWFNLFLLHASQAQAWGMFLQPGQSSSFHTLRVLDVTHVTQHNHTTTANWFGAQPQPLAFFLFFFYSLRVCHYDKVQSCADGCGKIPWISTNWEFPGWQLPCWAGPGCCAVFLSLFAWDTCSTALIILATLFPTTFIFFSWARRGRESRNVSRVSGVTPAVLNRGRIPAWLYCRPHWPSWKSD